MLFSQRNINGKEKKVIRKRFLPSKRPKRRYLAFEIISKYDIDTTIIKNTVKSAFMNIIGEEEMDKSNFSFLTNRYNAKRKRGLLRVTPKYQAQLINLLNNIKQINQLEVQIRSIGVSGTVNKAYNRYIVS